MLRNKGWIDNAWCGVADGRSFTVTNPATGGVLAQIPDMGPQDVESAVNAARAAWPDWRDRTAKERGVILHKWYDLIVANHVYGDVIPTYMGLR